MAVTTDWLAKDYVGGMLFLTGNLLQVTAMGEFTLPIREKRAQSQSEYSRFPDGRIVPASWAPLASPYLELKSALNHWRIQSFEPTLTSGA